jgi:hypothetical protein
MLVDMRIVALVGWLLCVGSSAWANSLEWSRLTISSNPYWVPVPRSENAAIEKGRTISKHRGKIILIDGTSPAGRAAFKSVTGPVTIGIDVPTLRDSSVQAQLAEVVRAYPVNLTVTLAKKRMPKVSIYWPTA